MLAAKEKAAVVCPIPATADHLWFQEEPLSVLLVAPAASAKQQAMADLREAACHLPAAPLRAASGREVLHLAAAHFESGSPLAQPMAEATGQAKQQRRLRQRLHL